ncbi:MAG: hypothetical protein ABI886_03435 [Betaproteobacteria bacterium]
MPLVALKPLKARLVIEDGRENVLVMRVALADGESVVLSPGGRLEALRGVLRIRERPDEPRRHRPRVAGTMVYVPAAARDGAPGTAKFQVNVALSSRKFEALLRIALAGALPTKFFVDAGEKVSPTRTRGLGYGKGAAGRTKVWDTAGFRTLPVTDFSMVLPVTIPASTAPGTDGGLPLQELVGDNLHLAELAEEMLSAHAESRATLTAALAIIGIIVLLILLADLVLVFK